MTATTIQIKFGELVQAMEREVHSDKAKDHLFDTFMRYFGAEEQLWSRDSQAAISAFDRQMIILIQLRNHLRDYPKTSAAFCALSGATLFQTSNERSDQ